MSHKAVVFLPFVIDLVARDRKVAIEEARNYVRGQPTIPSNDPASGKYEAKLLAVYFDDEDGAPPPMAA